jgi:cell division protein FtsQ
MMPDVEPVIGSGGMGADPAEADVSERIDVSKRAASEPGPSDAVDVEAQTQTTPGEHQRSIEPPAHLSVDGRHDRLRKAGAIAFIATVMLGAAAVTLTRSPFFYARTIEVLGASHVARADVLRMAAITPKTNVFTLDTQAAEVRLERDPWIAEATITKDLPSRLVIDIHERFTVAVMESGGVLRLVADDGALLEAAFSRAAEGLPVIASSEEGIEPAESAVEAAARAIAAMAPTLRHRIEGVAILVDGQLRVDLSTGAQVAYGEAVELPEKAMALRALLDYAAENGASVISADVRVPSAPTAVLSGGTVASP